MASYRAVVRHGLTDNDVHDSVVLFDSSVSPVVLANSNSSAPAFVRDTPAGQLSALCSDAIASFRRSFGPQGWACVVAVALA